MVTALRQLGFDSVLDTDFTADLTIIEEGTELLTRLKKVLVER
jgi:iron only hydrogenase large subunit-like protein